MANVEHLDLGGASDFPFQLEGQTTDNRDDEFYINNDNTRDTYSKPLQTITIRHDGREHTLTYRQARNLLMQRGPLRDHFRDYKRRCNQNQESHGRHCHSLQFEEGNDRVYTIENCINGILQRQDDNPVKQALVVKLQNFNPRAWREDVKRVSYKKPRLDSTTTRDNNRSDVSGERPPQRLRGEVEVNGQFQAFHTINSDVSMQKGAIKHRLNVKHRDRNNYILQHALTTRNFRLIRRIIQTNKDRRIQIRALNPDFNVQFTSFEELNDVGMGELTGGLRKYKINYTGSRKIPKGTIVNVQTDATDTTGSYACVVIGVYPNENSFEVILRQNLTITGFDFVREENTDDPKSVINVVPAANSYLRGFAPRNGFNYSHKRIISTGNTNGTFGVPMLLAKAGISRKDSTRSTLERQRVSKTKVCQDIQNREGVPWSKESTENYKLRNCDDLDSFEELYKKKDVRIRGLEGTSNKVAVRQYNLDEALDIMIAPDPQYCINETPFERMDLYNNNAQNVFETFVIDALREAAVDGNITGNMLLQHLQRTYPTVYKLPFQSQKVSRDDNNNKEDDNISNEDDGSDSDGEAENAYYDSDDDYREPESGDEFEQGAENAANASLTASHTFGNDDDDDDDDDNEEIFMKNGGALLLRRKKKKTKKRR